MEYPVQITARNFQLTEAEEAELRRRAAKLEQFDPRISGCRIAVEAPVRHHRRGGPFKIRIDLKVPKGELAISHQSDEELMTAIREAFDAARRRLEDHVREVRGAVKSHEGPALARVARLFSDDGYGFLETPDGREIYFHRNSVLAPGFERLEVGSHVRFAEEEGEKGPQASTVTLAD